LLTILIYTGLCIEANPAYWQQLSFRDCQVVAAVVGRRRMEKVAFSLNNANSGIVGSRFDNNEYSPHQVAFYTVSLSEILERHWAPPIVDYMSLDIEGAEYYVMGGFPFEQYTIKVMTIERPLSKLVDLLEMNGYEMVKSLSDFGETLWVHKDYKSELNLRGV
jgi:Methyltransferase FkbM domain